MNVLFDLGHPAHLHLFRNFIAYLKKHGHNPVIVTRDKDVINALLNHYGFDYVSLTKPGKGLVGMLFEMLKRDWEVFKLNRKYKFKMAFGTSVSIAHLSLVSKCKSFNFNEDDDGVSKFYEAVTYPFTTNIVTPNLPAFKSYPRKAIRHNSYHELAYLHPNNFKPDESVLKKYKLKKGQYVIIRKNTLKASHDIGARGLEDVWDEVLELVKPYDLVMTKEGSKTHQIDPWDMHHVIAFAKLMISDSQTMTEEAAVLGVPSVRMSSFVGRCSVIEELENKYELSYGFKPGDGDAMLKQVKDLLNDKLLESTWKEKRAKLLNDKTDLNEWIIKFFEDQQK